MTEMLHPMPFHEWLRDHRGGVATDEWAAELAKLMEAVRVTGRKGTLNIKVEVSPKGRSYVVTDQFEGKLPKFDAEASVYFLDDSGSLVRHDPAQQQFDIGDGRTVTKGTGEIGGKDLMEDAQAIIDSTTALVGAAAAPQQLERGKRYAFVLPGAGGQPARVERVDTVADADAPERSVGSVEAHTASGFQAAVTARIGLNSDGHPDAMRLYADVPRRQLVAVLNDDQPGAPGWRDHRVDLRLRPTPEWTHWTSHAGLMSLPEFGHVIEDGVDEITVPSAATMLEVAQNFTAAIDVKFVEAKRLANGQRQFVYQENVDATAGGATIPEEFTLTVAPYFGSEAREVTARLRYEVKGGQLRIGYTLVKADRFEQDAFDDVVAVVSSGLGTSTIEAAAPSAR